MTRRASWGSAVFGCIPLTAGRVITREVTRELGKAAITLPSLIPNLVTPFCMTADKPVGSSIRPSDTNLGLKGILSHAFILRPSEAIRRRLAPSMLTVSRVLLKRPLSHLIDIGRFRNCIPDITAGTGSGQTGWPNLREYH